MNRSVLLFSLLLLISLLGCRPAAPTQDEMVARGAYLVTVGGCNDCHSPKSNLATAEPDKTRLLSGRPTTANPPAKPAQGEISVSGDLTAWWGPWGASYAANLTPDRETGIGARYDEAKFIQAMRTGKKPEGEPLLPPMPWPSYAKMTDADLKAVYAYLSSLPPIKNNVREAAPQ